MNSSDINLLPKKKKLPMSIKLGIPLGIILLAIICAIGVLAPSLLLGTKQAKLTLLEQEISSYSEVETQYLHKLKDFITIQEQQKNYNEFIKPDKQTWNILNKIRSIKPATITLMEENFDTEKVVLSGYGTNDIEIARFEVAMRKLDLFSEILLSSITGTDDQRNFSFTLMHKADTLNDGSDGK